MPQSTSRYVCSACGFQSLRWYGRCPECGQWNTLDEEIQESKKPRAGRKSVERANPVILSMASPEVVRRFSSGLEEFDRTLGGGFVPGSLLLLGGEPGIGKSTLLLSVADNVAASHGRSLYISGEESLGQVKIRADRLGIQSKELYFAAERDIDGILDICAEVKPGFLVIDSIQTCQDQALESLPGTLLRSGLVRTGSTNMPRERMLPLFWLAIQSKQATLPGQGFLNTWLILSCILKGI